VFTILHLSDLHRSHHEPLHNQALIASLVVDSDRYIGETPAVPFPSAVIVSGDLIQGARLGDSNHGSEVKAQYAVAAEFLGIVADRFLDGDRARMVIVPGNHDVSWNTAYAAMRKLTKREMPADISSVLNEPGSRYRWSWKECALYKIEDPILYAKRLEPYWEFVEGFYDGVGLPLPLSRTRGFNLFELYQGRVVVAAFESLDGNDCFAYHGALVPDAVAACSLALRDLKKPYLLKMAVWHHSVQGPPQSGDYMNVDSVYEMIGHGFRLGVHGHQHVAAAGAYYLHLPETEAMGVASAGSLCAGARELPRGVNRQYNLIVIDDEVRSARIHVREMAEGNHFVRKSNAGFQGGFTKLSWEGPKDAMGREVDPGEAATRAAIEAAEQALAAGDAASALSLLRPLSLLTESYGRRLFFEAADKAGDWTLLADGSGAPLDASELTSVAEALIRLNREDEVSELLDAHRYLGLPEATVRDLKDRAANHKIMRRT
jgi:hypothetical protein